MQRVFLAFFTVLVVSSCATIFNRKYTRIEIHTRPDSLQVSLDTAQFLTTPFFIQVPRSTNDFRLSLTADTVTTKVLFKSRVAPQVWGNLVFMYGFPIGVIVDMYSKTKMFAYRKDILVDFTRSPPQARTWYPDRKGRFFLNVNLPGLTFLSMNTGESQRSFTMLCGLIVGSDYYYHTRRFISLGIGVTGAFNPANKRGHHIGPDTTEWADAFTARVNHNHDFKYASIGYGISLSNYMYRKTISDTLTPTNYEETRKGYWVAGVNLNITYRLFQFLTFGLSYVPSIYNLNAGRFEYSHLVMLDVGMRLDLKQQGKRKMKVIQYNPHYAGY